MQAVATVRRRAGGAKTGHAGTLDPLASGILVMALGRATKCIDQIMQTDKRYRTDIDLSAFTSTDDAEGERDDVEVESPPTRAKIEQALQQFLGDIQQIPPAHSAVKIGGRRAYKLARAGQSLTLGPRSVHISDLRLAAYDWPIATVEIDCGKGVYVRSLARDLGKALGTGGHCASLRRTAVGPFDESMAIALDDVPEPLPAESLMSVEQALQLVVGSPPKSGAG